MDADYRQEYEEAVKFPEFQAVLYNYDNFVAGEPFRLYPAEAAGDDERCIYRGWMLQPEVYARLFEALKERKLTLINTPAEYENCHEFPLAYPAIADYTPGIRVYPEGEAIDWREVKHAFPRFMMKDYVKSVKGTDFPACFDSSYDDGQLDEYARRFQAMRGDLYVRGIVLKEYVDLKRRDSMTNEYRAFYLNGELLTLSPNSNQKEGGPVVPIELVNAIPVLDSHFYTVDFAELENGSWTVIETGDGQVSGFRRISMCLSFTMKSDGGCAGTNKSSAGMKRKESAEDRLNIGSLHFFHCFMGIRGRFSSPVRSGAASHHLFIGAVKG